MCLLYGIETFDSINPQQQLLRITVIWLYLYIQYSSISNLYNISYNILICINWKSGHLLFVIGVLLYEL